MVQHRGREPGPPHERTHPDAIHDSIPVHGRDGPAHCDPVSSCPQRRSVRWQQQPRRLVPPEPARSGSEPTDAIAARRADYENVARALCADCPLRAECLELALREEHDLPRTWVHGIRGGTAPWQRARLIVRRRRIAAQQSAETTADRLKALRVSNHRGTLRIPVEGFEGYQVRLAQAAIDSPDEVA